MATTIKLKNSVTTTNAPSSLAQGEVAINVTDKKVWVGNAATTPVQLLGAGSDGSFTNISVSGVASFADGTVSLPSITNIGDTNTGIYFPAADTIAFTEGGVESMRIDSSGNVGIGTSSPSQEVELKKDQANSTLLKVTNKTASAAATAGFQIENSTSDLATVELWDSGTVGAATAYGLNLINAGAGGVNLLANNAGGTIKFATGGTTERMRIDSSGNVGIGTSSPADKLVIAGGNLLFSGSNFVYSYGGGTSGQVRSGIYLDGTNTKMEFYTAQAEAMRIDSSGNLLVGTTAKLQDDNKFVVQGSGGNGGNGIGIFYNTGIDSSPSLVCSKGSTTTSSSARFIQFYAGGVTTTAMGGIVGNGASNVQFASLSDAREKTNIQSISGSLEKINALNPVEFDWITDGSHIKAGFVAQEVEQVFPEFVVDNMSNDGQEVRKGLTGGMTGGIVAHLVKAIQELKTEVDALKSRIETLESK